MPPYSGHGHEEEVGDLLDRARRIAKRIGIRDFEIFASTSEDRRTTMMANGGRSMSVMESRAVHARVIHKDRLGSAFTNTFGSRQVSACLRVARELASHKPEDAKLGSFAADRGPRRAVAGVSDKRMDGIDLARVNDMMDVMVESAIGCKGDIRITEAIVNASTGAAGVVNSQGTEVSEARTHLQGGCAAVCGTGQSVSPECISAMETRRAALPFDDIGFKCGWVASHCCKRVEPKTEECDVVFSAQAVGMGEAGLLTAILPKALSGMEVVNRTTLFEKKIGKRIASRRLSIRDDPTLSGRAGSSSFDDEGTPTRNKWIVRDGTLRQFVWDNYYGALGGDGSTGNAVRAPSTGMVFPMPLNLVVRGSDGRLDDLISEIDSGYLIWGCQGAHTSNSQTGDFSFVASPGLKIKRGDIVGGVQGAMVSGNILGLLSEVESIGDDMTDFGSSLMPSMSFRDVRITTG